MSWDESAPPTALRRPLQMTPRHLIALRTAGTHPEAPSWAAHLHLPQPPRSYQLPPACSSADAHVYGCGCVSVLPRSGGCTLSQESLYEAQSLLRAVESAFALTSALWWRAAPHGAETGGHTRQIAAALTHSHIHTRARPRTSRPAAAGMGVVVEGGARGRPKREPQGVCRVPAV